jgi:hypothetical protein
MSAKHAYSKKHQLYAALVATNPVVEQKGSKFPYTSANGHMFSYLTKDGRLALRLPKGEREAFLRDFNAKLCEAYGIVQAEYVEVPDVLFADTLELKKFFDISYQYVSSLKPRHKVKTKAAEKR